MQAKATRRTGFTCRNDRGSRRNDNRNDLIFLCGKTMNAAVSVSPSKVRGRGGTVLQPGVDLLQQAGDFPPDGPILVITDGFCDRVRIKREHAFLLPKGHSLPFPPKGPLFRVE